MPQSTENLVYQKASKCWECVDKTILLFTGLLKEEGNFGLPDYYKARNLLRDADAFYEEALKNAKKLLGPPPSYSSADYLKWRDQLLEEFQILAMSQEYEKLRSELVEDEFLRDRMTEDVIERLLKKHFQTQQSGKRKLSNIKVRMILNRLEDLIAEAKELNKQVGLKMQSK
jgi:hypothetical protein